MDAAQLYDGYLKTRALLMDGVFNQNAAIMENQSEAVDEVLAGQIRSCLQSMQELISERRYNETKAPAATMMDQLRKSRFPPLFQEVMLATEQLLGEHAKRGGLVYPYSSISQAKKALLATLSVLEKESGHSANRSPESGSRNLGLPLSVASIPTVRKSATLCSRLSETPATRFLRCTL